MTRATAVQPSAHCQVWPMPVSLAQVSPTPTAMYAP